MTSLSSESWRCKIDIKIHFLYSKQKNQNFCPPPPERKSDKKCSCIVLEYEPLFVTTEKFLGEKRSKFFVWNMAEKGT